MFLLSEKDRKLLCEKRGKSIVYQCKNTQTGEEIFVNSGWVRKNIKLIDNAKFVEGKIRYYTEDLLVEDGVLLKVNRYRTSVVIPHTYKGQKITAIEECCFLGCSLLKSVIILPHITSLDDCCFLGCSRLETVIFPPSVVSLGRSCFDRCEKLRKISDLSSLEVVGRDCFFGCKSLEGISLPSAKIIGSGGFCDCVKLKSISIPSVIDLGSEYVFDDDCIFGCFERCKSLESISISATTMLVGNDCFYGSNLKVMEINKEEGSLNLRRCSIPSDCDVRWLG